MARGRGKLTPQDLEYMQVISQNINQLLQNKNYKQIDLSKGTGIPTSTITGYVKGTSLPIPGNIQKMADFFNVAKSDIDPRFNVQNVENKKEEVITPILTVYNELHEPRQEKVLHFAEEQLAEQQAEEQSIIKEDTVTYLNTYRRKIAVTEAVAAGRGFSYGDNDTEYCYTDQENLPNFDIASYVTGDSMEPHYHDGDVVLIRKEMYANPAVYVVDYDGKSYLKKVYRESNQFRLVSFNKNYDDIIIDLPLSNDTYLNIVGRVVGSFKPMEGVMNGKA